MIALRNGHPLFRRRTFFRGRAVARADAKDIVWLKPDGQRDDRRGMGTRRSRAASACTCRGAASTERDDARRPVDDDDFLLLFNAHHDAIAFRAAAKPTATPWHVLLDTASDAGAPCSRSVSPPAPTYPLQGRSLVLLRRTRGER